MAPGTHQAHHLIFQAQIRVGEHSDKGLLLVLLPVRSLKLSEPRHHWAVVKKVQWCGGGVRRRSEWDGCGL